MTITTNTNGTSVINADEGRALRRKTDVGPTQITRVALSAHDSADNWTDCDYAENEEQNAAIEIPSTPTRRFETVRLYVALVKAGLWDAAKSWLATQTIESGEYAGVNALEAFNRVVVVRNDHPLFEVYYSAIKSALGISDEQAEAILSAAEEN